MTILRTAIFLLAFLSATTTALGDDKDGQPNALSPDGKLSAVGTAQTIRIFDAGTQKEIVSIKGHTAKVTALAFSPDGNHISTWVNGYQTVDWTDDRKADDNPRKGSRTAAGHLSIQGHDPTTDLSFRNLRIVELKSEKK